MAIARESYFWHKLHSLTGIIPVGYYLVQHLTLNTFSLGGPAYFNGVIAFFEGMPKHVLYALKIGAIWLPLIFHAVYGLFITARAQPNLSEKAYRWRENRFYTWQRASGILVFLFLCYHMASTSAAGAIRGTTAHIQYAAWSEKLSAAFLGIPYFWLAFYMIGVLGATYHLSYGIWNFCIRWGITVSDRAQRSVQRFSAGAFVVLTLLGWAALVGFLIHDPGPGVVTVMR
jgi:succinate dehydrogenase / fumarate reductase cytochrome b subunit